MVLGGQVGFRRAFGRDIRRTLATFFFATLTTPALRAAEVSWEGPDACANRAYVVEQVEALSRRSLTTVEGFVFEIRVEGAQSSWELVLITRSTANGESRERRFHGKSCTEVSDAAAVAVAMTLGGEDDSATNPEPKNPEAEAEREVEKPAAPVAIVKPARAAAKPERHEPNSGVAGFVAVGALVDGGALPSIAVGPDVSFGIDWKKLRLVAEGGYFLPNRAELAGGRGGTFDLLFGALSGCFAPAFGRIKGFGCLGYELGSMSGEGTGVDDPRLGSALWQAARLELGAAIPLSGALRVSLGLGATLPLDRPEFVLDAGEIVHRPSSFTARARAGVELPF